LTRKGLDLKTVALLVNLDKLLGFERETFTAQAARVNRC